MASLEIITELEGTTARLVLSGRLDAASADALSAAIPGGTELQMLILDMGSCTYVSSMGIRVILSQHKALVHRGGRLELVDVQPEIKRVFELSGLTQLVTVREKAREISLEGLQYLAEGVLARFSGSTTKPSLSSIARALMRRSWRKRKCFRAPPS